MSFQPARQRAVLGHAATDHDHAIPADHHSGSRQVFLRRHEREAQQAAQGNKQTRREFAAKLLTRAGDSRNVYEAIEHCASKGQSAGPDGTRPSDLSKQERWSLAAFLGEQIKNKSFRPQETREVRISKGGNRGYRTIQVQNFSDRSVERSLLQIIRPYIDVVIGRGYENVRSGMPTEEMLAIAERIMLTTDRKVCVSVDAKNAFDNVPRTRLLAVLRHSIGNQEVVEFLDHVTRKSTSETRKGIKQGGPLSPWLLETYFRWTLEKWWNDNFPDTPLLWFVDDFLALTRDLEEAQRVYAAIAAKMTEIGLSIKECEEDAVSDLRLGNHFDWLGFRLNLQDGKLRLRLADKSWEKLSDNLAQAYEEPVPAVSAYESITGWINAKGPAFGNELVDDVFNEIVTRANELDFYELPSRQTLVDIWQKAHLRDWVRVRRETVVRETIRTCSAGSFADQQRRYATLRRAFAIESAQAESSQLSELPREVTLHCDGSCLGETRIGGWAYSIIDPVHGRREGSGSHPATTNNRMELTAVLNGLRACPTDTKILVVVDSRYVEQTLTKFLADWIHKGWRSLRRKSNPRLWHKVARELEDRYVECRWVRGHSGYHENERVDQLASAAAESLRVQLAAETENTMSG